MAARTVLLGEIAQIIRSKNAGPFLITFDILFSGQKNFEFVAESEAVNPSTVAAAFGVPKTSVSSFFVVPHARAFKITLKRPFSQGDVGETDVYGCQQHVPLMTLPVPEPVTER